MAIKLADTARPNNYVDAEHLGTYPVAYAEDVWFEDGTRLSDLELEGGSIQKTELPLASSTEEGKIYQYIGATGTYTNGYFYKCVEQTPTGFGRYEWQELKFVENPVVYSETVPEIQNYETGNVVLYTGTDTPVYFKGHSYRLIKQIISGRWFKINGDNYFAIGNSIAEGDYLFEFPDASSYVVPTYIVTSVSGDTVTAQSVSDASTIISGEITNPTVTGQSIAYWEDIGGGGSGESSVLYADAPIGAIIPYGSTTAPTGWLICDGQAVNRTTYAELFAVIGTAFGTGDGGTTFNLPDLREATTKGIGLSGKSTYHYDNDGIALGEFIEDRVQNHRHNSILASPDNLGSTTAWTPAITPNLTIELLPDGFISEGRFGSTTEVKAVGVNYIIKAEHTPVPTDFMDAVDEAMNECKILPYEFNRSSNISNFNRKWLVDGSPITWTATHTGRLTIRCLKHGDGYSLYLTNQNNVMLDSYDNFFSDGTHSLTISEASITLQAWVRKGDIITLTTNLPANTDYADKFFVQTGLLAYNDNFD